MGQKLKIAGWISVGVMAGALTTVSLQTMARGSMTPLPLEELQQLAAVFGMVKSDYVEAVDDKKLITDAISGMVASLDPHSQYFDKKSFKEFREGTTGRFVGVGIEITQEEGLIKIVSPIEGSPAFRAGLKTNDLITKIDDTAVKSLSLNEAVKRMRGEPNTKVTLTILRRDEARNFPVTITREEIKTQSVKAKMSEPGYGWVRLSQFQERTVEDFVRKVTEVYAQDPKLKGLVLDLRNDPGGLLEAAVAISAAFLPQGVTVVSTDGQLEESKAVFKAEPQFYARRSGDPLADHPARTGHPGGRGRAQRAQGAARAAPFGRRRHRLPQRPHRKPRPAASHRLPGTLNSLVQKWCREPPSRSKSVRENRTLTTARCPPVASVAAGRRRDRAPGPPAQRGLS